MMEIHITEKGKKLLAGHIGSVLLSVSSSKRMSSEVCEVCLQFKNSFIHITNDDYVLDMGGYQTDYTVWSIDQNTNIYSHDYVDYVNAELESIRIITDTISWTEGQASYSLSSDVALIFHMSTETEISIQWTDSIVGLMLLKQGGNLVDKLVNMKETWQYRCDEFISATRSVASIRRTASDVQP
jgi:hypothetical protein